MKHNYLDERYEPPYRLPVRFSESLSQTIEVIKQHNLNNCIQYEKWYKEHLLYMLRTISTPSVAFDYANQSEHHKDGTIIGHGFAYTIETDEPTQSTYVYIMNMDLCLDEYGLMESKHGRNALIITESKLRRIIAESIRKVLYK